MRESYKQTCIKSAPRHPLLFLSFLCHPYTLTIFLENFYSFLVNSIDSREGSRCGHLLPVSCCTLQWHSAPHAPSPLHPGQSLIWIEQQILQACICTEEEMCSQQTDTYKYLVCVCVCVCVVFVFVCMHACVCYKTHTHTHIERETTFTSLISNNKLLLVTAPAHGISKGHITVPQWKNSGGLQQLEREQEGVEDRESTNPNMTWSQLFPSTNSLSALEAALFFP